MKQACIDAVANTLGRQPKADEIKNIEDRIKDAVRVIARRNARKGRPASLTRKLTVRRQSLPLRRLCMRYSKNVSEWRRMPSLSPKFATR